MVKSISAIFTFIFGPDYRQAMYGKSMKKNSFVLDKNITVTNHGSYGAVPKKVLEARWQFQVIQLKIINLKIKKDFHEFTGILPEVLFTMDEEGQ